MARVLVTGATGFLGGTLAGALMADGIEVIASGRDRAKLDGLPTTGRVPLDLTDPSFDPGAFAGVTTIVHCAALSSAWGSDAAFEAANVTATRNCLDLARQLGVAHFVHISTPAIYFEFRDRIAVGEDAALPKPVNAYARTKRVAEGLVARSGVPFTILRPRGLYGRGDTALLPRLTRAARTGRLPRFRRGAVATDITHVDDAVDAIRTVLRAGPAGRAFNVSGGVALPIVEIVERACRAAGTDVAWRDLPVGSALVAVRAGEWLARLRPGRPEPRITAYGLGVFSYTQTLDLSAARDVLGWEPRIGFDEGLRRTFGDGHA